MKWAVLPFLFLGSVGFACPNLAGSFVCKENEGSWEIRIEQVLSGEVTTYQFETVMLGNTIRRELIADGRERLLVQEGFRSQYSSRCEDEELRVKFLSLLTGGDLLVLTNTSAKRIDDQWIEFSFQVKQQGTHFSASQSKALCFQNQLHHLEAL